MRPCLVLAAGLIIGGCAGFHDWMQGPGPNGLPRWYNMQRAGGAIRDNAIPTPQAPPTAVYDCSVHGGDRYAECERR